MGGQGPGGHLPPLVTWEGGHKICPPEEESCTCLCWRALAPVLCQSLCVEFPLFSSFLFTQHRAVNQKLFWLTFLPSAFPFPSFLSFSRYIHNNLKSLLRVQLAWWWKTLKPTPERACIKPTYVTCVVQWSLLFLSFLHVYIFPEEDFVLSLDANSDLYYCNFFVKIEVLGCSW